MIGEQPQGGMMSGYKYREAKQKKELWEKELIESIVHLCNRGDMVGMAILADYFCDEHVAYHKNQRLIRRDEKGFELDSQTGI